MAALTSVAQLVGVIPQSKRLPVQFPVRAHAWVVALVPGCGSYERQLMDVSLSHQCFSPSLSSSLPLSLLKKKKAWHRLFLPNLQILLQIRLTDTKEMYFLENAGAGVQPHGASNLHSFSTDSPETDSPDPVPRGSLSSPGWARLAQA